jgi:hypothetical protein
MSETADVRHKHRHDLGEEDHGPKLAVGTTRAIQVLLAMWIAATLGLILYALLGAGRAPAGATTEPTASEPQVR